MFKEMTEPRTHQGRNVKMARIVKDITQETLAQGIGLKQSQISDLEKMDFIDPVMLDKIARYLDVSIKYLETYIPDEVIGNYYFTNNGSNNTLNDDASENIVANQTINNNLPENIIQEYFQIIRRQDKRIYELEKLLTDNNISFDRKVIE